ncbi:MAG TPA: hypothetical protein VMK16_09995, partial [Acidimicrobiales bacterium]|nr:hypothetical protein [Acidimicrobiales bacterium]
LIWQATHGWPQLDMARSISQNDGASNRGDLLPLQVLLMGPLLFPVWIAGFWWLLRNERTRLVRPIAWAYPVLLVATFLGGGKGYYFVPLLFVYLAAGAVVLDRWIHTPTRAVVVGAAVALTAVASAFLALPLLPVRDVGDSVVADVNPETLETVGWPRFVDQVAAVVASLPPDQRASVVLFTANYGEAGAIDRFGPARGLPRAYSGHNSYSDWGIPPDSAGPVVLTGFSDRRYLDPYWTDCRIAAHVDDGVGVDNDEQGLPIWVCDAPVRPWADMWDDVTHYD